MIRLQNACIAIYYSFPIQLFILLIKRNQILLFYWLILFGVITGNLGGKFGVPFLFLDPEYVAEVNSLSTFIMGIAVGVFIMAYTISSYILNGVQFPFLAALSRPFAKYFLNNFIVPLIFVLTYIQQYVAFQYDAELQNGFEVFMEIISFAIGGACSILLVLSTFFTTDKTVFQESEAPTNVSFGSVSNKNGQANPRSNKEWRVDNYIISPIRARLTRNTEHYDKEMLLLVARKNHINAAVIELILFMLIVLLGLFRETDVFGIPAAASVLLFFSMLIMLTSAYRFWLSGWAPSVALLLIVGFNILSENDVFLQRNQAYGISYAEKANYALPSLIAACDSSNYTKDVNHTLQILEKWKTKAIGAQNKSGQANFKPSIILICTSGGGMRASLWTVRVLQKADSVTDGTFFHSTAFISGASGGTIGASYYRELYLRQKTNSSQISKSELLGKAPLERISRDLLNPIMLSLAVNDIFMNFQHFEYGGYKYKRDRAYAFEKQLNDNTEQLMDKTLGDYAAPENSAAIPMMVISPTIVNDGRRLFISPQPISYLIRKNPKENLHFQPLIEGVEYSRLFEKQKPLNIRYTSVLRMNASFPYISPTVSLPSEPSIMIMDAGMRDNFGLQTTIQFVHTFKDWLAENTSQVLIVQIRDTKKELPVEKEAKTSLIKSLVTPLETFYTNFAHIQDYNQDELAQYAGSWYQGNIHFINFQMVGEDEKVSLSWHLTSKEKRIIIGSMEHADNQRKLDELKDLILNAK